MSKNNVIPFPTKKSEKLFVDFSGFDQTVIDKVFSVMDLLDNRDELIEKFTPKVKEYLTKDVNTLVKSPFKVPYDEKFTAFIQGLIRDEIVDHYNYTPEEILILTEKGLLDLLTEGFYFVKDNYNVN